MAMMIKLRRASALTSAPRMSVRLGQNAGKFVSRYHLLVDGILKHLNLPGRYKTGIETTGAMNSSKATPAVSTKLMPNAFLSFFHMPGSSKMRFKAKMANRGIVNSAMTRIDDTARNLLYIGI